MDIIISLRPDGRIDLKAPDLPVPMLVGILEIVKLTVLNPSQEEPSKIELANTLPFPKRVS